MTSRPASSSRLVRPGFLAIASVAVALAASPLVRAQSYELGPGSALETGCIGPSPCDCLAELVGPATGQFTLTPLLPPLGPIFEYAVDGFEGSVMTSSGSEISFSGDGLYTVDVIAETHSLVLDLTWDGVVRSFDSGGFVPGGGGFPELVSIAVYAPIDTCLYDGLTIEAVSPIAFLRGDCNANGQLDVADVVSALAVLFTPGTPAAPCRDACDVNDDGFFDVADPIYTLMWIFVGGPGAPPPGWMCGPDPTADDLDCALFAPCP